MSREERRARLGIKPRQAPPTPEIPTEYEQTIRVRPSFRLSNGAINPDRITYDAALDRFEEQLEAAELHRSHTLDDDICIIEGCTRVHCRSSIIEDEPDGLCFIHHDLAIKVYARQLARETTSTDRPQRHFDKLNDFDEDDNGYQKSRDTEETRPPGSGITDHAILNMTTDYDPEDDFAQLPRRIQDLIDKTNANRL